MSGRVFPLCLTEERHFSLCRELLVRSGYTEQNICARTGLASTQEIYRRDIRELKAEGSDLLAALIELLFLGSYVRQDEVLALLTEQESGSLRELGVLVEDTAAPDQFYCPATIYPVLHLFFASDRFTKPDRSELIPAPDIVYPASSPNTKRFLSLLPRSRCNRFLELCAGTAPAAILAAHDFAERAWASDILPRCTHFAEFNRRLNQVRNLTLLTDDLCDGLEGLTFDRIVAHPPYVPSKDPELTFRDSREEGEEITRRVIEQIPTFLEPGGKAYIRTLGLQREGKRIEERWRNWLGAQEREFDVAVFQSDSLSPEEYALTLLLKGDAESRVVLTHSRLLRAQGVEKLASALGVFQRADSGRKVFSIHREMAQETTSAQVEWLVGMETAAAEGRLIEAALLGAPVLSPKLRLHTLMKVSEGTLGVSAILLETPAPFLVKFQAESWSPQFLNWCDGKRSGALLHSMCVEHGFLPGEVPAQRFGEYLAALITSGLLLLEGATPPEAAG